MGKVNKSPEELRSPIIFFAISTPISPPNKPPIIVLELRMSMIDFSFITSKGFSKSPTTLEPKYAPAAAPMIMDKRLLSPM